MKRRILIIGPLPPPHFGGSVFTQMMLESSLSERYEMRHFDTSDRRGVENIGRLDVRNVWLALTHGVQFVSVLLRHRFDMVYLPVAQNSLGFLRDSLFLAPAVFRGVPLVIHFHSGNYGAFVRNAPTPMGMLVRALLSRVRRAIVLGTVLRPMLSGVVPAGRVDVVPNCVPDPGPPAPRKRGEEGRMRILFLGNLIPGKGYAELISAAESLAAEGVHIELVLAGGGMSERERTRTLAATTIPERIRLTGPVDAAEKRKLLSEADVLALPSYYENEAHPLVILEAMAAGVAVVSTWHVAIPEIVSDGITGLLVHPRDVGELGAALARLAADPDLRVRMGEAGRARYLAEFTEERWVDRMSEVFDAAGSTA